MKELSYYHPACIYMFFAAIFLFAVISRNPVFIVISFAGAIIYSSSVLGIQVILTEIKKILPFMLVITAVNPLINRYGGTPLFFINDSAFTLEALIYGFFISMMLAAVFIWGKCFNTINDSEKTLYIASYLSRTLSIIISMSLRFIPMLKIKLNEIKNTRKAMGLYYCDNLYEKIKSHLTIISVLLTWSIENSVDTAASMRSRGFGIRGRTSYSVFKMRKPDVMLITVSLIFIIFMIILNKKVFEYSYYPYLQEISTDTFHIISYVFSALFVLVPTVIELRSRIIWKLLKSKT